MKNKNIKIIKNIQKNSIILSLNNYINIFFIYLFDFFHFLIGLIILGIIINILLKIHNFFSKDNIKLDIPQTNNNNVNQGQNQGQNQNQLSQPIIK